MTEILAFLFGVTFGIWQARNVLYFVFPEFIDKDLPFITAIHIKKWIQVGTEVFYHLLLPTFCAMPFLLFSPNLSLAFAAALGGTLSGQFNWNQIRDKKLSFQPKILLIYGFSFYAAPIFTFLYALAVTAICAWKKEYQKNILLGTLLLPVGVLFSTPFMKEPLTMLMLCGVVVFLKMRGTLK